MYKAVYKLCLQEVIMNLDYSMKMTQQQKMIMTQNMQQSIKLLQMSLHVNIPLMTSFLQ